MGDIEENKENEQYFFDKPTQEWVVKVIEKEKNIAFLSCPSLSQHPKLKNREDVTFLDIDKRFPRIIYYDLNNPEYIGSFDVVVFDPPFFNVTLKNMEKSVELLLNFDFSKKLLIAYLARREKTFLRVFRKFELKPIHEAKYESVVKGDKNKILFYANFDINNELQL